MYARMRGITPARPQFETRPLLLDVIEVPRSVIKTGLYSREASILGNMVIQWNLLIRDTFVQRALSLIRRLSLIGRFLRKSRIMT